VLLHRGAGDTRCGAVTGGEGRPRNPADDGATGYAVVWKNDQTWKGVKVHMGYSLEAYDAECAALARALETASRRQARVTVFTDAQAAIRQIASEEPGPARSTRSRQEGISQRYGGPDRVLPLRSGGAPHKKG